MNVLLALLASCAWAGPSYDLSLHQSSATLRVAGAVKVAVSSSAPTTARILLEGVSGGVNASSFTATYGVVATSAAIRNITAAVSLTSTYGLSAATGAFTTGVTVGTLSVTGAADFKTLVVSSQNATTMLEVSRYGVVGSTTQPAARWTRSSALSTGNNASFGLTFNERVYNAQDIFAVATATVPTGGAGLYRVSCTAGFGSNSTGRRAVWAALGGTLISGCKTMIDAVGSDDTIITASCTPYLAEAAAITCHSFQSSGGALDVTGSIEVIKLW
jgi:hypothetical protein